MAIYLCINLVTSKLSRTWKTLKPKTLTMWKRISSLMSPNDNFSHYREAIKNVETPYIPCQEVILKDLLYHDAFIPDFIEEGVWNFKKLHIIGKILDQFRRCQLTHYHFAPLKELQNLLTKIPTITSVELDLFTSDFDTLNTGSPIAKSTRIITPSISDKSDIQTESDTTDDSSIGHPAKSPTGLMRSNSSRPRYGSLGSNDHRQMPRLLEVQMEKKIN